MKKQATQKQKILILAAIPHHGLRLDTEIRSIQDCIRGAVRRDVFEVEIRTAVRPQDIRRAIAEEKPLVVHFCGHGLEDGSLLLEDDEGQDKAVQPSSLASLFKLHQEYVKCVLLNTCHSAKSAEAISKYIRYTIGMNQQIQDESAIKFAQGFYDGLGYKLEKNQDLFQRAFDEGLAAIELENLSQSQIPVIIINPKIDAPTVITNTHKLVIGTPVIGLSAVLVGLILLVLGNDGLITKVLLTFGIFTLWVCCAYVYYPSSQIFGFGVSNFRLPTKQYRRLRRLALAGMIIIPIIGTTGFYVWQLPPKDMIVLTAEFKGEEPEKYRVTQNIFDKLHETLQKYPDVKVQRLNKFIKESDDAINEGKKHKAAIVIWGDYGVTDTHVQLSPHFEVLRTPEYLPKIEPLEKTAAVSELKSFQLQTTLSGEMTYLSLFTVGLTRYTASDWNKAIDSFSDALKVENPSSALDKAAVYFFRGTAYVYKKDYNRAIVDYNQALKLDPNYDYAYYNRGLAYYNKKDYDRAIADYNQALKLDPNYANAYYNRGLAYDYKKDYDRAIADYNQALKLDPKNANAYIGRGLAYYNKKDYDRAIADYNQALKLDPNLALAYYNRGLAYYDKKDYDRAIVDYNQALKLDPNYANAYYNRGLAYDNKKDYDRAIVDYNQALKLDPNDVNAYIGRGLAYYNKKDYDRAIADYNQALKIDPKNANAYYNRGLAYYDKKDYDRAIADYNQALKLDPNYANAYIGRGLAYYNKKDYDRGIADYNQVLKIDPNYANAYYNRGLAYYDKKDYDRAIADYNQALKLDPNYANAYYNRGLAYYDKKDYDRAIADYNQALKLDPNYANAYYNRGLVYKNKSSKDKAALDFKKVLELNGNAELKQEARQHLQELGAL
ncbi:TPR domain protein [Calothrix sp. NIES-4071]|nr:TPR domain protein [Calothrix sp. NIES-4071]BAZ54742.1 TPR domain protein [Calothrix sp. NIES-4105]